MNKSCMTIWLATDIESDPVPIQYKDAEINSLSKNGIIKINGIIVLENCWFFCRKEAVDRIDSIKNNINHGMRNEH